MGFILGRAETYGSDYNLFKKLGLKTFSIDNQAEHKVGEYENKEGKVSIYVTCMPAQFWRFEIYCNETKKKTEISTGSGTMSEYWNTVEMVLDNMIDIKLN